MAWPAVIYSDYRSEFKFFPTSSHTCVLYFVVYSLGSELTQYKFACIEQHSSTTLDLAEHTFIACIWFVLVTNNYCVL